MFAKTLIAVAFLCTTASYSYAQKSPAPPDAIAVTREMSARLQLNEGQYVRLLKLNRVRLARQQEIEQATATSPAARTAQLTELQTQFEQECSRILSPSQLAQLQQDDSQPVGNG